MKGKNQREKEPNTVHKTCPYNTAYVGRSQAGQLRMNKPKRDFELLPRRQNVHLESS